MKKKYLTLKPEQSKTINMATFTYEPIIVKADKNNTGKIYLDKHN